MYTCDESQLLVTATVVTSSGLRGRRPQVTGSTTDADDDERLDVSARGRWTMLWPSPDGRYTSGSHNRPATSPGGFEVARPAAASSPPCSTREGVLEDGRSECRVPLGLRTQPRCGISGACGRHIVDSRTGVGPSGCRRSSRTTP